MRILILGGAGMLGHKLFQACARQTETWATVRDLEVAKPLDPERTVGGVDALQFDTVERAFASVRPDAAVNCIGIVKQSQAAKDPRLAVAVNSLFPHRLAALCEASRARLVHISTDCVFSGRRGMRRELDEPDPQDLYGRSKLLGEPAGPSRLTIRTSMIGRELRTRHGLLEWFLNHPGPKAPGYRRAIFSGMPVAELSRMLISVLLEHSRLEGLYHVAADPIDKCALLELIRRAFGIPTEVVEEPGPELDRSLDGSRFRDATGLAAPPWPEMIQRMAEEPVCVG